jgi:hypothetical protein
MATEGVVYTAGTAFRNPSGYVLFFEKGDVAPVHSENVGDIPILEKSYEVSEGIEVAARKLLVELEHPFHKGFVLRMLGRQLGKTATPHKRFLGIEMELRVSHQFVQGDKTPLGAVIRVLSCQLIYQSKQCFVLMVEFFDSYTVTWFPLK